MNRSRQANRDSGRTWVAAESSSAHESPRDRSPVLHGWYVAKSKPRKEVLLISNLSRWGVETFYPQLMTSRFGATKSEPLFPTYVFCRLDPRDPSWQAVRWSSGLSYFLGEDEGPSRVSESLIEYIDNRVHKWNQGDSQPRFLPDAPVTIARGPFAGMDAIFKAYVPARQRCRLLIELMGNLVSTEVPEYHIENRTPGPLAGIAAAS